MTSGPLQSVAETPAVKSGTDAWQVALAVADWFGPQLVIAGGVVSVTEKFAVQVDPLFATSFTTRVIV